MAPPFVACFGAIQSGHSLIEFAYAQIAAYRTVLLPQNSTSSLVRHIVLGGGSGSPATDYGYWSTGNAWLVSGVCVLLNSVRSRTIWRRSEQI